MNASPLLVGIGATVIAALQLSAWIALGSFAVSRRMVSAVAIPVALLIGSAATAFVYALLSFAGCVDAAIWLVAGAGVCALALRWRWVVDSLTEVWRAFAPAFHRRWVAAATTLIVGLYWLDSIVPPRDGDVMRYHLAHIRQIIRDGRWAALPDYTYALPFGWTLNYLPFERMHLPETAHLVNLGLWLLTIAVIAAIFRLRGAPPAAFLLLVFVALQPLVLKSATTAFADLYAVFVVLAIVVLLDGLPGADRRHMMLLGFVSTVGAQSRYQLLGVSVSVLVVGVVYLLRRRITFRLFGAAALGATAGLLLASPFYIVNYLAFHNPFWPLLIPKLNDLQLYTNRVAENVNQSLTGPFTPRYLLQSTRLLLVDKLAFPIPVLALALLAAPLWSRDRTVRLMALFNGAFLVVWAMAQPSLYSRFSILLVAPVTIGLGLSMRKLVQRRVLNRLVCVGFIVGAASFFLFDIVYSRDSARYVLTADADKFHQATWFYPVYKWVNDSTPSNSRFLVIVGSGHSYYLDRSYRKADPFLSGYVDWETVDDGAAFAAVVQCAGFDYVIYEARDWSGQIGGRKLDAALRNAIRENTLNVVKSFSVRLVTSRVGGEGEATTVWLLRPKAARNPQDCAKVKASEPFLD